MSGRSPGSTEEDGTGHQVSTAEDSAVRMIGQCDRHHAPADALPAGRRHPRRCTPLVQYVVADSHLGRRDQFGSHGHCLHRTTDSDAATSLLKLHTLGCDLRAWTPSPGADGDGAVSYTHLTLPTKR